MTTVHQPPRRRPTPVDRLADGHLAGMLRLSPEFATMVGTPDADQTSLSDYSPEGTAAWRDLLAGTLSQLDGLVPADGVDAVTVSAMRERIGSDLDLAEAGQTTGELNVLSSPIQSIRDVFNLMPAHTDEDRAAIGARLAAVPAAIAGYRRSLALRLESGPPIALRQVERCADQCDDVAGEASPFLRFADDGPGLDSRRLGRAHGQVDEDAVGALVGGGEGVRRGQVDLPSGDAAGDRLRMADRRDGSASGSGESGQDGRALSARGAVNDVNHDVISAYDAPVTSTALKG